jgi:hypothetical protein
MDITCLTCTMYRDATILVGSQVKPIDGIFDSIRFVSFRFRFVLVKCTNLTTLIFLTSTYFLVPRINKQSILHCILSAQ